MTNLALIVNQIKNEISVDATGKGRASVRATARLIDVDEKALRVTFEGAEQNPSKLAEFLMENGFQYAEQILWSQTGIPDLAIAVIAKYYAYKAGRYCKKQAELVDTAFTGIGVRSWLQQQLGWKRQETKPTEQTSQGQNNSFDLQADAIAIDLVLAPTGIDSRLIAGVKANHFSKIRPELAPAMEEAKKLLSIPVEENLVRPGKLAELYEAKAGIKLSAQKVNKLLADKGLQIKNATGNPSWLPTEEGKQYSELVLDTAKGHNKTVQSLQWHPSVIDVIW
jgi:hypothetical protein